MFLFGSLRALRETFVSFGFVLGPQEKKEAKKWDIMSGCVKQAVLEMFTRSRGESV